MPSGALQARLVAEGAPAGQERGTRRAVEAAPQGKAQALFPRVEVTLKTADALPILEAGRRLPALGEEPEVSCTDQLQTASR